jgi:hypothetical protein
MSFSIVSASKSLVVGAAMAALLITPAAFAQGGADSGGSSTGGSTSGSNSNKGGGASTALCGSTSVQPHTVVVYTTRTGIGFDGVATNCSQVRETFEVDVTDTNPDPACAVVVPHYTSLRPTQPGNSVPWSASSTLVNCQGTTHNFNVQLLDSATGTLLDTQTVSFYL